MASRHCKRKFLLLKNLSGTFCRHELCALLLVIYQPVGVTSSLEQAARALANLAAHGDSNSNNADVGLETGALEALVQLTFSKHEGVSYSSFF